jgi:DNA primase
MSDRALLAILAKHLPRGRPGAGEYASPCPFHKGGRERRPSFSVNLETGLSFCQTCHQGWNFRTLLQDLGLNQRQVDIEMAKLPSGFSTPTKRKCLFKGELAFSLDDVLPEIILAPYRKRCPSSLLRAGFEKATLKHFEVGYDRTGERVIYPVRNHRGSLINVVGRVSERRRGDGDPKHFPLVREIREFLDRRDWKPGRKRYLWNMHRVYPVAYHEDLDQVIVVEGYKQLMWVWQCGYKNVVSLLGSYMTRPQRTLLRRLGCDVVLFLDNDKAGWDGTLEAAMALRGGSHDVKVCEYPEGAKQPDGMDEEQVQACIENPLDTRTWRKRHGV